MSYEKRQVVKIVEEICKEDGIKFESFSGDYFLQLTNQEGKRAMIYGFKFPNNDAAISKICDDKAALSDILKANGIPCVEHLYFEGPKSPMTGKAGLFAELLALLDKHGKLVIKTNSGSGGKGVYKCETVKDVEIAAFNVLGSHRSMTVAPYVDIENEYRVIVQNGKPMVMYAKQRPNVTGDGISTIKELIEDSGLEGMEILPTIDLEYVPSEGENVTISWKHNLGQGSLPVMISDKVLIGKLSNFALRVAEQLNLKFASIDIVKDKNGGYKVLEINSGVMMETFSKLNEHNYAIAKHIYRSAIYDYFDMPMRENIKTYYENVYEEIQEMKASKGYGQGTKKVK